ncbi:MAG: hypothetical protein AABY15_00970 [Nanoarchaeota archaeon]
MPEDKNVKEEDVKTQTQDESGKKDDQAQPEPQKGGKTDETKLYAALKEEREKRKAVEQRMQELESSFQSSSSTSDDEDYSEAEIRLRKEMQKMNEKLVSLEAEQVRKTLENQYPQLIDKKEEFEEFLEAEENKNIPLARAAKLFLLDNNLLETSGTGRMGLEKPSGGERVAPKSGMSSTEAEDLRKNHPKKYRKMLIEETLKPEEIHS